MGEKTVITAALSIFILSIVKWLGILIAGIVILSETNDAVSICYELWIACLVYMILDTLNTFISCADQSNNNDGDGNTNPCFNLFKIIFSLGQIGILIWITWIHGNMSNECRAIYHSDYSRLWDYSVAILSVGWIFAALGIIVLGIGIAAVVSN